MGRLILVLSVFLAHSAWGLTPQKYCETLPATSCEVLNVDTMLSGGSSYIVSNLQIKYCRDRVFKVFIAPMATNGSYYGIATSGNGVVTIFFQNSASHSSSLNNTSLCSNTIFTP